MMFTAISVANTCKVLFAHSTIIAKSAYHKVNNYSYLHGVAKLYRLQVALQSTISYS